MLLSHGNNAILVVNVRKHVRDRQKPRLQTVGRHAKLSSATPVGIQEVTGDALLETEAF